MYKMSSMYGIYCSVGWQWIIPARIENYSLYYVQISKSSTIWRSWNESVNPMGRYIAVDWLITNTSWTRSLPSEAVLPFLAIFVNWNMITLDHISRSKRFGAAEMGLSNGQVLLRLIDRYYVSILSCFIGGASALVDHFRWYRRNATCIKPGRPVW